jgi:hypothetical protein
MFRRTRRTASPAILSPHAQAVAARLARLAAAGEPVAPATFANDPRRGFVCVYAERAGGVRMVAHVADARGRREWHAPVTPDGVLGRWEPVAVPVTRAADLEAAFALVPA